MTRMNDRVLSRVRCLMTGVAVLLWGFLHGDACLGAQTDSDTPVDSTSRVTDLYGDAIPDGAKVRLGTVRFRGPVGPITFTADGKSIVSVDHNSRISVWDVETGHLVHSVNYDALRHGFAAAPDGSSFAFSFNRFVNSTVGDLTGILIGRMSDRRLETHTIPTGDGRGGQPYQYSQDGQKLIAGSMGRATIYDATAGTELETVELPTRPGIRIDGMAMSPDHQTVVIASDKKLFFWDVPTQTLKSEDGFERVYSIAFSPDGSKLAIGYDLTHLVTVLDAKTRRSLGCLQDDVTKYLQCLNFAFTSDSSKVVAVNSIRLAQEPCINAVLVWNLHSNELLYRLNLDNVASGYVAVSPDGSRVAATTGVGISLWDLTNGERLDDANAGHQSVVRTIRFSPAGDKVCTAGNDGRVQVWDANTGQTLSSSATTKPAIALAVSPNSRWLAVSLEDTSIDLYDAQTLKKFDGVEETDRPASYPSLAFSSDSAVLRSLDESHPLRAWNVTTGKLVPLAVPPTKTAQKGTPGRIDEFSRATSLLSADASLVCRIQPDAPLRLLDTATGTERISSQVAKRFRTACLSPDGRSLLLVKTLQEPTEIQLPDGRLRTQASRAQDATLIDLQTGRALWSSPFTSFYGALTFAPNGKWVAVGQRGEEADTIHLIDVETGKAITQIPLSGKLPPYSGDGGIAFHSNERLAVAFDDGTALVWDLRPLSLKK